MILNNFIYITPAGTDLKKIYDPDIIIDSVEISSMQYTIDDGDTYIEVTPESPGYAVTFTFSSGGVIIANPKDAGRYDVRIDVSIYDPDDINYPTNECTQFVTGYFTSLWDSTDPNKGSLDIVNAFKFLSIDRAIGIINTPTNLTHVYDGLNSPIEFTTEPADISCYVTYSDGSLDPPSEVGNYTVTISIVDSNYKDDPVAGPYIANYYIVLDTALLAQQLLERQALLDAEASASLNEESTSSFVTNTLLMRLDSPIIREMSNIGSIADCAKSLPDRLMKAVISKVGSLLSGYGGGTGISNIIKQISSLVYETERIMQLIENARSNPLSFLDAVLASSGVYASVNDQIHALESQYPFVNDVAGVLNNINNICYMQDYNSSGIEIAGLIKTDPTKVPSATTPTPMPIFDQTSNNAKMDYDGFLFQLKDAMAKDNLKMESMTASGDTVGFSNYVSMLTAVTTVINSYHDDITHTTDNSKDAILLQKYISNVARTRTINPAWNDDTFNEYDKRTARGQSEISKNTNIIRAYFMKNVAVIGGINSKGATVYSGPKGDFTTYLDIIPPRPAELTAYWESKGYNIPVQEAKMKARNPGWHPSLSVADTTNGAYGPLISDQTIASSRWPGDSVIALKNPNGSAYNPIGKNPSGTYIVSDTGNANLTYNKPDIYTNTPDAYSGLDAVEAFVVSLGTKMNSQYKLAHQRHPENNTNGVLANV